LFSYLFNTLILTGNWLANNYIEILGVATSLVYLYFSVRQIIWLWPFGILSSALFIYIFYRTGFYADMSLQGYYLLVSVYGWYYWIYGARDRNVAQLPVTRIRYGLAIVLSGIFIILWLGIVYILKSFTDSDVPWGDAFTTAGSIIATWMLARKILEHWLLWIVVDAVAASLYFYKTMYPTVFLYLVYTFIAIVGFYQWKKKLIQIKTEL
jgi:nicotinamide mononucleotide transporter